MYFQSISAAPLYHATPHSLYSLPPGLAHPYSASNTTTLDFPPICTPPLLASAESRNGSFHPPSLSGVAIHSLSRCRRGKRWRVVGVRCTCVQHVRIGQELGVTKGVDHVQWQHGGHILERRKGLSLGCGQRGKPSGGGRVWEEKRVREMR